MATVSGCVASVSGSLAMGWWRGSLAPGWWLVAGAYVLLAAGGFVLDTTFVGLPTPYFHLPASLLLLAGLPQHWCGAAADGSAG